MLLIKNSRRKNDFRLSVKNFFLGKELRSINIEIAIELMCVILKIIENCPTFMKLSSLK